MQWTNNNSCVNREHEAVRERDVLLVEMARTGDWKGGKRFRSKSSLSDVPSQINDLSLTV